MIGSPLPTDTERLIRIGIEARAIRPWELFDEGLVPWEGFIFSAAVVGQFGFAGVYTGLVGPSMKAGDLIVVSRLHGFVSAGSLTVRYDSSSPPTAGGPILPRDTRISNPPQALNTFGMQQGSAAAITGQIAVNNLASGIIWDTYYGLVPTQLAGAPPRPNVGLWANTANTAMECNAEGIFIPQER